MMVTLLLSCSSQVQAATEGEYTYTVTNDKATITKYTGTGGNVNIPSTLGNIAVTSIGVNAFNNCVGVTSVTIPQGVTSIGFGAFEYCNYLTSINIPQSVTTIDKQAFFACNYLTNINIPSGVTIIRNNTFGYCYSLTSINIPQSVTTIEDQAFFGCSSLTSIALPQGITSIGVNTFANCTGLTNIAIPQGVTSIADSAFYCCSGLTSIKLPQGVSSIGMGVFAYCNNLSAAYFYGNAPSVGEYIFYDTKPGFTVYYLEGKAGFTNPWNGYPTAVFKDTAINYIINTTPNDGDKAVSINQSLTATFAKELNAESINTTNFTLKCESQSVPITINPVEGTFEVVINPQTPLQPLKSYTLSFSQNITDIDGLELSRLYSVNFVTCSSEDAASISILNQGVELKPGETCDLTVEYKNLEANSNYNIKVLGSYAGEKELNPLKTTTLQVNTTTALPVTTVIPVTIPETVPEDLTDAKFLFKVIFEKDEVANISAHSMSNDSLIPAQTKQAKTLVACNAFFVNTYKIYGYVRDKDSGKPLSGIKVELGNHDSFFYTYTDAEGFYGFRKKEIPSMLPLTVRASLQYSYNTIDNNFRIYQDSSPDTNPFDPNIIDYLLTNDSGEFPIYTEEILNQIDADNSVDLSFDKAKNTEAVLVNAHTSNNAIKTFEALKESLYFCAVKGFIIDYHDIEINDDDYNSSSHNYNWIVINHMQSYCPLVIMHEMGHSVDQENQWGLPYYWIGESWANLLPCLINQKFEVVSKSGAY